MDTQASIRIPDSTKGSRLAFRSKATIIPWRIGEACFDAWMTASMAKAVPLGPAEPNHREGSNFIQTLPQLGLEGEQKCDQGASDDPVHHRPETGEGVAGGC